MKMVALPAQKQKKDSWADRLLREQCTQLTAYKPDNVCNASIPSLTGKNLSPQSQRRAHRESINAFCIPQYIVSVKIIYSIFWKLLP